MIGLIIGTRKRSVKRLPLGSETCAPLQSSSRVTLPESASGLRGTSKSLRDKRPVSSRPSELRHSGDMSPTMPFTSRKQEVRRTGRNV